MTKPTAISLPLDPAGLPDGPGLIGVSGGRDSIALLHAVVASGARELIVCHLDHGLRKESREEAAFVHATAEKLGLKCVVEREDVEAHAAALKQSIETTARRCRHAFFARAAAKTGRSAILLAHHADDQVETFLFNLLRGSGGAGLVAMRSRSEHRIDRTTVTFLRPLLGVWRDEIDAYVQAHSLAYREDTSNRNQRHTRNRIRHDVLPALEASLGREVKQAIWRSAEIARAEHDFIESHVPVELATEAELRVGDLVALPISLQRRALLLWLRARQVPNISFEDVENVRRLVAVRSPAKVNLSAGLHARRRAGKLFVEQPRLIAR
jgi:tRNA(Ile)-lysidine synthase